MAIPDRFLRLRSSQPYIKTETTAGSFIVPVGGDAFTTTDPLALSQTFNTTDVSEVGTRLLQNRSFLNYAERSTFDIPFLVKPSGSAGTAPAESDILQKMMGTLTTAGGTSNTYSFSRVATTFQVAQIVDTFKLYVANGTVVEGFSLDIARDGVFSMSANCRASRIRYSGPATATGSDVSVGTGSAATATITPATNAVAADYFFDTQQVVIYNSSDAIQNSGNPFTVSSVSTTGATLGLTSTSGTYTLTAGDYLVPFLVTPTLSSFEPISQGDAQVFLAAQNAAVGTGSGEIFNASNSFLATGFSLNVSKNLGDPGVNELTGDKYPSAAYVTNQVDITGSFDFIMRPAEAYRFEQFSRLEQISIGVQVGDTSGKIVRVAIPSARVSITGAEQDGAAAASVDFSLTQGSSSTDAAAFSLIYL